MGLSPLVDQQLGGLVMWLPGDMLYAALIIWTFSRWLDQEDSLNTLEQQISG